MEDVDLEKGIGVRDDGDAGRPDGPAEQRVDLNKQKSNNTLNQDQFYDAEDPAAGGPQQSTSRQLKEPKNQKPPGRHRSRTNSNGNRSVEDLDPAADRLATNLTPLSNEDFCSLIGIRPEISPTVHIADIALPHGLYAQVVSKMHYNNKKYKAFAFAVYFLLVVQTAISAVFIILGSIRKTDLHLTIAVLGAVATVISGGLGLMNGQGLPNRLRQTRDSLRNIVFEAEELYWDARSGRPVLYKDVKKLREDYLRVLERARQRHPDSSYFADEISSARDQARKFRKR